MRSRFRLVALAAFVAVLALAQDTTTEAQSAPPEYRKIVDELFVLWNDKKQPQNRGDLIGHLIPSLEARVKNPILFYEDSEWLREAASRLDRELPESINPKLRVSAEAMARYMEFLERFRLPFYAQRFKPDEASGDLLPKFYALMAIAQRNAETEKSDQIQFRHLRRSMFFWETVVWPLC